VARSLTVLSFPSLALSPPYQPNPPPCIINLDASTILRTLSSPFPPCTIPCLSFFCYVFTSILFLLSLFDILVPLLSLWTRKLSSVFSYPPAMPNAFGSEGDNILDLPPSKPWLIDEGMRCLWQLYFSLLEQMFFKCIFMFYLYLRVEVATSRVLFFCNRVQRKFINTLFLVACHCPYSLPFGLKSLTIIVSKSHTIFPVHNCSRPYSLCYRFSNFLVFIRRTWCFDLNM